MTNSFSHDYVLSTEARRQFDALEHSERVELLEFLDRICERPEPDGRLIHDLATSGIMLPLADDGQWAIVFDVVPSFVVRVFAITPSPLRGIEL